MPSYCPNPASFALLLILLITSCGPQKKDKTAESAPENPGPNLEQPAGNETSVGSSNEGLEGASGPAETFSIDEFHEACLEGDRARVARVLESGVDVNAMDADGRTALMFAAFNGHSQIVLDLLDQGAGVDRRDLLGRTALLYCATGPFPETVSILLDRGAEPNVVDSDEHFSPLMHAAAEGNMEVVRILLAAGADRTLRDVDGDDAASFARQAGHAEVAAFLEAR